MGRYDTWSKGRKVEHAIKKVLDEGWTQAEAARHYGISRQNLNRRVKNARVARAEKVEAAKEKLENARPNVGGERRRIPETLKGFWETYFTKWRCPDCQVTHDVPEFHQEISAAIRERNGMQPANKRVVVNIPPYHSKTTNVSVIDTVMDICENPNSRTIIVSKSQTFAKAVLYQIQEILTNPELYEESARNLIDDWGPFKPEQGIWNTTEMYVAGRTGAEKDPTVLAVGVGNQIYGRRADKIKFDDIATLTNQRNPEQVIQMLEWIDKEPLTRIGLSGQAIWSGTRVSAGDINHHLMARPGYKVIKYPALFDDEREEVLWGDHFPYEQILIHRAEMRPADFQLIYQNIDVPGEGAAFPQEIVDLAKDTSRVTGHYESSWRLIAGLDPAGTTKTSGFTAFTLLGIDLETGKRFLVDQVAQRAMTAPQLKSLMFEWTDKYPIYEWRVESNGLQAQIVQYNTEIIQHLAKRGVRVVPHITSGSNKWDPQFGVESMSTWFHSEMISIPWGNAPAARTFQPFIDELVGFPMAERSDRVMSAWFSDVGARELLKRAHLPMFTRKKVPGRIAKRRHVVDFNTQEIRNVPMRDQRPGHLSPGQQGFRRMTVGGPTPHGQVREFDEPEEEGPINIDPSIWVPK